jgi:hypothetical protein
MSSDAAQYRLDLKVILSDFGKVIPASGRARADQAIATFAPT